MAMGDGVCMGLGRAGERGVASGPPLSAPNTCAAARGATALQKLLLLSPPC